MRWADKISGLAGTAPRCQEFSASVGQPDIAACVPAARKAAISSDTYKAVIDAGLALFSSPRAPLLWPAPLRLPLFPRIDAAEAGRNNMARVLPAIADACSALSRTLENVRAVTQIGRHLIRQH